MGTICGCILNGYIGGYSRGCTISVYVSSCVNGCNGGYINGFPREVIYWILYVDALVAVVVGMLMYVS